MPRSHYGKFGRCNAPVPAFAPCACRQRSIDPRLRWIAASTDALGGARWDDYPMRPTVLIVDDHAEFRRSAGALLEAEGFAVIAEGADGDEAIAAVERVRPRADGADRHARAAVRAYLLRSDLGDRSALGASGPARRCRRPIRQDARCSPALTRSRPTSAGWPRSQGAGARTSKHPNRPNLAVHRDSAAGTDGLLMLAM